ncbi:MAG: putative DNA-binding protein [Bacteroidetes bacterium]|nr:putative DNA-binding protein [Bacteroidota bacterium]
MSNTISTMENLIELHKLIKIEMTGTSAQLAEKMRMSKRAIQYYLNDLRLYGAVIDFNKVRNTYYYINDFNIEFTIKISVCD